MPRKKRVPAPEIPSNEPIQVGAALADSPLGQILASRDARAEPDQPMPEHSVAIATFQRQREREQAVAEMPPPDREVVTGLDKPARQRVNWADTVRSWENPDTAAGVQHVTAKVPVGEDGMLDMVGIRFRRGMERTPEEKREMEAIGLKFNDTAKSWLKQNRGEAFDETQAMTRRFAENRREQAGVSR